MGNQWAHIGSAISHGGSVVEGSPNYTTMGIPLARVGDEVICSIHGTQTIVTGSSNYTFNGKALARIGSVCSCGATIVSSTSTWTCD